MKTTVVVLNWRRPRWLRWVILPRLVRHPAVDEVIVSHGREDTAFQNSSRHARVRHRDDWTLNERYGLALRFVAAREAANEAVLLIDDDIVLPRETVDHLIRAFEHEPDRLHGAFGRGVRADGAYDAGGYLEGEVPILLTRCLIMPRTMAAAFLEAAPLADEAIRRGTPKWNGEDIFLSLLSLRDTGLFPKAYRLPFRNVWGMHRESISQARAPGDEGLPHVEYREWFAREAARLLGVEARLREWWDRSRPDSD